MPVTKEQVRLIEENLYSIEEENYLPQKTIFESLNSEEQYYLADMYNWDEGVEIQNWVINSDKCDLGTAIMIFWRAEPDYYFDYNSDTIKSYQRDVWELLQSILKKVRNNEFVESQFEFIPIKEGYNVNWGSAKGIWELPEILRTGINGKKPIIE